MAAALAGARSRYASAQVSLVILSLFALWQPLMSLLLMVACGIALLLVSLDLQIKRPPVRPWMRPAVVMLASAAAALVAVRALGVPLAFSEGCTACDSRMKNLAMAVEMYFEDHKRYPATLEELVPTYINPLHACPGDLSLNPRTRVFYRLRGFELSDGYGYRADEEGYVIWCRSDGISGHARDRQPWYSSRDGIRNDCWFTRQQDNRRALGAGPDLSRPRP